MKMTAIEKHFVNEPRHARRVAEHALRLVSRVKPEVGWRYLDVGCGVGAAASEIANATGLEVTGVDVDPTQIAAAQNGPAHRNLRFKVMDATKLEFRDGEFDIVATSMATHHIPNWECALAEMVRVLRAGGYLIYTDHVFPSWLARLGRLFIRSIGFPSARALDSLAASAGLAKIYAAEQSGQVEAIWLKSA